jgi:hypothetical protein
VHLLDPVVAEVCRVIPNRLLVGCLVDAVGHDHAVVADDDVAVLPHDLRVAGLDHLARAAADLGHVLLPDVEFPDDEISAHQAPFRC